MGYKSKILSICTALYFVIAILFAQVYLPYYNSKNMNQIVMSEEEETSKGARTISEEMHVIFDFKNTKKFNNSRLLAEFAFYNKTYKPVYIPIFSPPPEFLLIS